MKRYLCFAVGVMLIQNHASAQSPVVDPPSVDAATTDDNPASPTAGPTKPVAPEFVPMTASERARKYLLGAFGPGAILPAPPPLPGFPRAASHTKGVGVLKKPDAYGDRFGNAFAKHVVREALEYGMSAALHEDNRYFSLRRVRIFQTVETCSCIYFRGTKRGGRRALRLFEVRGCYRLCVYIEALATAQRRQFG